MEPIIITALVWILIVVGLVGTIVPILPGMGLVFGGILLYALYFGVSTVGLTTLVLFGVATGLSFVIDLLSSLYGAARFGASRSGVIGSAFGGILGLMVLNVPGLLLGVFAGAVLGEYFLAKKNIDEALKAGVGSMLGFLGGTVIKLVFSLIMVTVFIVKIWF